MEGEPPFWARGVRWRVGASIIVAFGWLIFILLYAAFSPPSFTLFQNIVAALVSILVSCMVLALLWASYGMRFARRGAPGKWADWRDCQPAMDINNPPGHAGPGEGRTSGPHGGA